MVKVKPRTASTLHGAWLPRSWLPKTSKRGELGCLAMRPDWQEASSVSCLSWVEGNGRPTRAGRREQRSWAGPKDRIIFGDNADTHMKPLGCLLGCLAQLWCGHNPDTAATVWPAEGWGTRALGPLCGLSGDLHPTLNNRVESRAGAGPRVVCRESAPCEQMKGGRGLAGGQRAGRQASPSQRCNWGFQRPGVD